MSDKELLELAAKAAGLYAVSDIEDCWVSDNRDEDGYEIFPREGFATINGVWNPLTDDGDALRLAVKLNMDISCSESWMTSAWCEGLSQGYGFDHDNDPYAATRRAIVRAAAEIGRMK